ncbi:MAG: tetratricopeptide repeat protein, partial [Caldilineaceae bacterium]|nr:tetratricopeptide repeat protein [Caldilineaceae bacterium]
KIGIAYGVLAWYQFDVGNYTGAYAIWDDALKHAYRTGDEWNLAMQLVNLGAMVGRLGELERAQALVEEASALHRRIGQKWGVGKTLRELGAIYLAQGKLPQAKQVLQEGETLCQMLPSKGSLAGIQYELAGVALAAGDYTAATRLLRESLAVSIDEGYERLALFVLNRWIALAVSTARCIAGLTLAGAFATQSRCLNMRLSPPERAAQAATIAQARHHLPAEVADAAWNQGMAMNLDESVAFALQQTNAVSVV